jgi:putative ABC transport system permease protein
MLSSRWNKLLGDAKASRGRLALITAALALSVAALATMLTTYSVLLREIGRNYLSTHPASAQIVTERVDEELVRAARRLPDVADAEASSVVRAKAVTPSGDLRPLLLFVISDFTSLRINSVRLVSGAWPTANGSVVLERTALSVADGKVGQPMQVELPSGRRATLAVTGVVHDPALAPAWQEQVVYGYTTAETLIASGDLEDLQILKLIVRDPNADSRQIEAIARRVALWLDSIGHHVQEIRVPPPRMHPHQTQMTTMLVLLLAFGVLGLVLGSVLAATMVQGLLAQHAWDIAVMKAIGARSVQIGALYLSLVVAVAVVATLIGTFLGLMAGRGWASASAALLNLDISSYAVPLWILLSDALVGTLLPVSLVLIPVSVACRRTVREVISDAGVSRAALAGNTILRPLSRVALLGPSTALGLRNAFRRRARLILVVLLISVAGAVFISSANLRIAWERSIAASAAARHYDLEISFQAPTPTKTVKGTLTRMGGVRILESWPGLPVNLDSGDHIDLSHSYPDEGHGRITLRATQADTKLVDRQLEQGRWPRAQEADAVVINSSARALSFRAAVAGDEIDLLVLHHPRRFHVVGFVREMITPATIYTTPTALREEFPNDLTNSVRIALADRSQADSFATRATTELERQGIDVRSVITEKTLRAAQGGHIYILVYALQFLAAMMALVGIVGLASVLSINVTERIREFGILRAIGARAVDIRRVVFAEAVAVGALGAALSIPGSLLVSRVLAEIVGRVSLQPLILSPTLTPASLWFGITLLAAVAAGLFPSIRAARLTVREAIALGSAPCGGG